MDLALVWHWPQSDQENWVTSIGWLFITFSSGMPQSPHSTIELLDSKQVKYTCETGYMISNSVTSKTFNCGDVPSTVCESKTIDALIFQDSWNIQTGVL